MTKSSICLYCGVELIIGDNWTESRQKNKLYNCRKCASQIARGLMSRKDRITIREECEPEYHLSPHNLTEMMGAHNAQKRLKLQQHIANQMTEEVKASLRRTDASIVRVFNVKKQRYE